MKKICKQCGEFKEIEAKELCCLCYGRKRRLKYPEKYRAASRKYRLVNPEKSRASSRKYYQENSEKVNTKHRKYRLANPKKEKARGKKYRLENPEKAKVRIRKWRKENPEKVKMGIKKWKKENPGKYREIKLRRRGHGEVKKGVIDRLITENILKYGIITCEQCREFCENDYHINHINPVSKGGSNDYDNLQILCAKHNREKGVRIIDYRQISKNNQMFLTG